MKKTSYLLLTGILVSATACSLYTDYRRPENLEIENLYPEENISKQDSMSIADISWRDLFTDPYLVKLMETGLHQNTDLRTAVLRTEEAAVLLKTSKLAFFPSVSLSANGNLSRYDGGDAIKTYSLGGTAEFELDIFGNLRNAKKESQASYDAATAYAQNVRTNLIATIADTYYSIISLDKKSRLTEEAIEQWEETLRTMQALKRAGEQTEAAVAQTEASLLSAKSSLEGLKRQITELENSLSTIVGHAPRSIERSDLLDIEFDSDLRLGVPLKSLCNRPDVRQVEYQLAEAFYATNRARAAFYPNITLSGSAGWTNSGGAAIMNPGGLLLSAAGALLQPVFNRGKNKANLEIAKLRQEEAALAFSQMLLNAGADVNNALAQWQTARVQLEMDKKQISSLEKAVKTTWQLMKYGSSTYLEVLTAQQTLLQAKISEVSDKYCEIQGVINLYQSLGGGS